jgi:hypothetical protein
MMWDELIALEPGLGALEREARVYVRLNRLKRQLLRHAGLLPPAIRQWAAQACRARSGTDRAA